MRFFLVVDVSVIIRVSSFKTLEVPQTQFFVVDVPVIMSVSPFETEWECAHAVHRDGRTSLCCSASSFPTVEMMLVQFITVGDVRVNMHCSPRSHHALASSYARQ